MSEEKKAIEDSKELINELGKHKDKDFIGRLYYKNRPIEDTLRLLLNIIERQQKEIEEKSTILLAGAEKVKQLEKEIEEKNCLIDVLQHKIEELLDNKKKINYIKPIDIPVHNYISKDKIREIINKYIDIEEHLKYTNQELYGDDLKNMILDLLEEA